MQQYHESITHQREDEPLSLGESFALRDDLISMLESIPNSPSVSTPMGHREAPFFHLDFPRSKPSISALHIEQDETGGDNTSMWSLVLYPARQDAIVVSSRGEAEVPPILIYQCVKGDKPSGHLPICRIDGLERDVEVPLTSDDRELLLANVATAVARLRHQAFGHDNS